MPWVFQFEALENLPGSKWKFDMNGNRLVPEKPEIFLNLFDLNQQGFRFRLELVEQRTFVRVNDFNPLALYRHRNWGFVLCNAWIVYTCWDSTQQRDDIEEFCRRVSLESDDEEDQEDVSEWLLPVDESGSEDEAQHMASGNHEEHSL